MTSGTPDLDDYLRVYQASARLFWRSSRPWPDTLEGQPQECRDAWAHLEQVLAEAFPVPTNPGAPSDPTRHLITRRGSDNRPVTLSDAAHDWLTRVQEQPGAPYPRDVIAEHPEMHGQKTLTTDFVLVTNDWCAMAMKMVGELQHRLAPGRPACTISANAQGLPDTLRHAADQLRNALAGHVTPSPVPDSPLPLAAPAPFPRDIDSERLDRLCWAAFDVVERTPGLAAVKAGEAETPDVQVSKAVDVLRRTLAGEEPNPWQGFNPRVNPADSLVGSSEDLSFTDYLNRVRTGVMADQPAPWVPAAPVLIDTGDEGIAYTGIPFPAAEVLIEVLDEVAARLTPGIHTETIGIDTYQAYYDLAGIRGILHKL
ncbi:hypothetical protein [Nocardiopsis ganjiahuensis]|uniref:hypothetical protein n=1 Tax=Nocardiopsis ganjiahuensis TaxID=239984 RepID=UPI0003487A32|nr:hypothetical protein [Nocardiopsis ganjiahuensis]